MIKDMSRLRRSVIKDMSRLRNEHPDDGDEQKRHQVARPKSGHACSADRFPTEGSTYGRQRSRHWYAIRPSFIFSYFMCG